MEKLIDAIRAIRSVGRSERAAVHGAVAAGLPRAFRAPTPRDYFRRLAGVAGSSTRSKGNDKRIRAHRPRRDRIAIPLQGIIEDPAGRSCAIRSSARSSTRSSADRRQLENPQFLERAPAEIV